MADEGALRLTADAVRDQVERYSKLHSNSNEFGMAFNDGKCRIPLKKLMKLFEIKKKCSKERQNLFRGYVNDLCDLEMNDEVGKVLVLRDDDDDDDEEEEVEVSEIMEVSIENLGYGDAAPEIQVSASKGKKSSNSNSKRENRLKLPAPTDGSGSGGIEIADCAAVRRQYNRRGSVTRYSIVAQNEVVDEYKQHEDIINQFRKDSLKIESSMRNLSTQFTVNDINDKVSIESDSGTNESRTSSKQSKGRGKRRQREHGSGDGRSDGKGGSAVQRFFRRGRFSLTF
jgi:hypothetical protein